MTRRNTDTVAKDFDSFVESLIEFATSEFGEQTSANRVWSNFNRSSFSRNWAELVAYLGDQISFYLDAQSNEAYLETATIPASVLRIAAQSGLDIPTQQAASGKVTFTTSGPFEIPRGTRVRANGIEFFTTRTIQGSSAGQAEVEVIQGREITQRFTAEGSQNEEIILREPDVIVDTENANPSLRSPIVRVNGNDYDLRLSTIGASSVDLVAKREVLPDGRMRITFGDGIFGRRLTPNESIQVIYRTGGGTQGNVESGEIDTIVNAIDNVDSVTNEEMTSGGSDFLTIRELKDRVPMGQRTTAGAINLDDFADILLANFPQVLTANSAENFTDEGIDVDVFVVPQGEEITPVTTNVTLFNTLNDFLERNKVVGARFVIRDGNAVRLLIDVEAFLNRDASRSSVESELRQRLASLYDIREGGVDGRGMDFTQTVKLGDLFDILADIQEIDRFEVKRFTILPRVQEVVASPNQEFNISNVRVFEAADENEWLVATSQIANPEPASGQVEYTVYKRTLGRITSLTEDSVTDVELDFTVEEGEGIVIGDVNVTDPANVFQLGQYDDFLLVDANNFILRIAETRSNSIVVAAPALNDASVTSVESGPYEIVRNFSGARIALSNISFSILYNNKNTFFAPGSSFNVIATARTPFFISEEQNDKGTYGVPVAITDVEADGPVPGDLVTVKFNGTPNFSAVTDEFTLIDRLGETFEVVQVNDSSTPVTTYGSDEIIDSHVTLTDSGSGRFIAMPFKAEKAVQGSFLTMNLRIQKDGSPAGGVLVDVREDDNGVPGNLIQTSILTESTTIDASAVFNQVSFTFNDPFELEEGEVYHLVVYGDGAYQISFSNSDGELRIGTDSTILGYFPEQTAGGSLEILDNDSISRSTKAEAKITVIDNNIRRRVQATNNVTIIDNDFTGFNQIIIDGVSFVEGDDFNPGGTIEATRDNLKAAIDAELAGKIITASVGTDRIGLTADPDEYPGELGNGITIEVNQASPNNFQIRSTTFGGGLDGDKIELRGPAFLNSTNVEYTYDSSTGVIEFQDPVSLPAFESGMLFVDGSDEEHSILAIDDSANTVTLDPNLDVDVSLNTSFSGSISVNFEFEFIGAAGLNKGATVDDTAENLKNEMEAAITNLDFSVTDNEIDIEVPEFGSYGNEYQITSIDLGTTNFEIDDFDGGANPDLVTIGNEIFRAVAGTPTSNNEFEVGVDATQTIINLSGQVNATGVVQATPSGSEMLLSALTPGSVGNDIGLAIQTAEDGVMALSGDSLEGGQDNLRLLDSTDGVNFTDFTPEKDLIFAVVFGEDSLIIASKADEDGEQVIPETSIQNQIDSSVGRRYYSDDGEVSFLFATKTPNAFIVGSDDTNLFGRGTVGGNPDTRVDQFIFRTSKFKDDVTTLRESEIIVLQDDDLDINLLGGVE